MHRISSASAVCRLTGLLLAFLFLWTGTHGTAQALTVKDVRFGLHPDKTRMVVDLDNESPYRVFVLSDPWRLVVDLPSFSWQAGNVIKPQKSIVTDIRKGTLDANITRIVIDLAAPARIKTVFFLPAANGNSDRLVIDVVTTSVAEAMTQKSRLFGELAERSGTAVSYETGSASAVTPPVQPAAPAKQAATQLAAANIPGMVLPPKKPQPEIYEKPLVVIDAGHGGADPGAVSSTGVLEKHITLSMAQALKKHLEDSGRYEVRLTRDRDKYIRLYERVDIARKSQADLFISLHADSIGQTSVRGASIYTLSETASDKQTEQLAMRENRADLIAGVDLSAEDEVVVNILVDLAMRDTMNQSKFLANTMVEILESQKIRVLQNPHRYAGFAVLKAPDVPSILVEMGFISNAAEARLLSDPAFQRNLSRALAASIDAYFERVQKNQRI